MVAFQNLLLLFPLSKFPAKFSRLSISSSKTVTLFAAARSWHRGLRALFLSSASSWPCRLDRACRTARADVLDSRLQSSRREAPAAPRQHSPSGPASSPPPTPKAGGPGAHRDGAGSLPVRSRPEGTAFAGGSPHLGGRISLGWGLRAHCEVPPSAPRASATRWQAQPPPAAPKARHEKAENAAHVSLLCWLVS